MTLSYENNNSVFYSDAFFKALKDTDDFIALKVNHIKTNSKVSIQGYITKKSNFVKNFFTRRCIINGNPKVHEESELSNLLKNLVNFVSGKSIYIEIRNNTDQNIYKDIYQKKGFQYEDHLNILVDLTKSEEELWKDVKSKRRNEIRLATKEGTNFEIKDDIDSLRECYLILKEVYGRAKLPLFKIDFFENLYKYLIDDAKLHIFAAVNNGKIIGCMLALGYNGILYDYYAGAKREYYNKHPNDLIPWEVFKWGKQNGYHTFDFGGAGKPGVPYKVRDYKKQFGGTMVNYGRFKLILNKPLYRIGEMGVKILKRL